MPPALLPVTVVWRSHDRLGLTSRSPNWVPSFLEVPSETCPPPLLCQSYLSSTPRCLSFALLRSHPTPQTSYLYHGRMALAGAAGSWWGPPASHVCWCPAMFLLPCLPPCRVLEQMTALPPAKFPWRVPLGPSAQSSWNMFHSSARTYSSSQGQCCRH